MLRTIDSLEAVLQAHSFGVFLFGVAGLVLTRTLAWFLDRPLRSRTGAGYARDAQLAALGCGAMAASLAVRVWWPVAFGRGLLVMVALAAVAGVVFHRTSHPPVAVALGSVFQAAFAGAAYLVAWPFLAWVVGAWVAYRWLTSASAPGESEEEVDRKRRSDLRQAEEEQASRWANEEQARRLARNAEPQMADWPF